MIVEVTGPIGVGKSTYLGDLLFNLATQGINTGAIHSIVSNKCNEIPTVFSDLEKHNIKTDIVALPWALLLGIKHPRFVLFCLSSLMHLKESFSEKIAIIRSLIRKMGVYRYLNQKKFDNLVIGMDEGLYHSAHNLLVSVHGLADLSRIRKFSALCPTPDLVILLNAPPEVLLKRLMKRGNFSPRVNSQLELKRFVNNAFFLYQEITSLNSTSPLIFIDNVRTDLDSAIKIGVNTIIAQASELCRDSEPVESH